MLHHTKSQPSLLNLLIAVCILNQYFSAYHVPATARCWYMEMNQTKKIFAWHKNIFACDV